MDPGFRMHAERTPNPNSIKWVLGQPILAGSASAQFSARPAADVSPLARALFDVAGVESVFLASNFVTVTKRPDVEWTDLAQPIVDAIKRCVASGEKALGPAFELEAGRTPSEIVARILRVLDEEVRPAVAMDGGDIVFSDFKNGIVELYMHGSCSGCPSATATLKMGIEARLREAVPEVQEVVAI